MQKNLKLRLGAVAAVAAVLAFGAVAPAHADPSSQKPLSGTGSDTTQDVMSGVASAVSAIGSYDAIGTSTITVNGTTFSRPSGSSAGVRALSSSIRGIAYAGTVLPVGTLQWARSSSLGSQSGSELTYIPFARDAVTIAMSASSDFPKDVSLGASGQSSTLFTLRNIYLGTVTSFIDSSGNSITIRPLLPQVNSGTRQFWVSALGTTESALTAGGRATDLGNTVQEHDGSYLTTDGDIAPFSVGQYIAQGNYRTLPTTVVERRGNIVLGSIDTIKPIVYDGTRVATNPDFGVSRLVYNVVETRALTTATPSATDTAIRAAFQGASSSVCQATTQIQQYGFATIGSQCGSTTLLRGYIN
ncbi:hypothetical protein [Pseudolysinimonas sp.]|uniref:hypothetical protein n=1 Tax=Pseudolysinimonas sp. TaxID=2680009 RepID=UPI00286B8090|nr:hypothetical protein [Pseudolysinimonas sp.]